MQCHVHTCFSNPKESAHSLPVSRCSATPPQAVQIGGGGGRGKARTCVVIIPSNQSCLQLLVVALPPVPVC